MDESLNTSVAGDTGKFVEESSVAADILQKIAYLCEVFDTNNDSEQQMRGLETELQEGLQALALQKQELADLDEEKIVLKQNLLRVDEEEADNAQMDETFGNISTFLREEDSLKEYEEKIKNYQGKVTVLDENFTLFQEKLTLRTEEENEITEVLERINSSVEIKHENVKQLRDIIEKDTERRDELRRQQQQVEMELIEFMDEKKSQNQVDRGNNKLIECVDYTGELKKQTQEMKDAKFALLDQNAALQHKLQIRQREADKFTNSLSDETLAVYDHCRNSILCYVQDEGEMDELTKCSREAVANKDDDVFNSCQDDVCRKFEFLTREKIEAEKAVRRNRTKKSNLEANPVMDFLKMKETIRKIPK
ncbi:unnamed protein product [Bursaphelenchus xylophilus]|uniref:(pine wood nematode) hypothetical protein n=1 Tax=Bursaphelenchus xylophilus TaxID=6326 RepID=A0A7I8X3M9_BURXY|nr:unnamed protein product [Bursaphelenchus xylophilus]CAG9131106.1 unnamed protein product [Bursaphelenchus xylophilus]